MSIVQYNFNHTNLHSNLNYLKLNNNNKNKHPTNLSATIVGRLLASDSADILYICRSVFI